MKAIVVVDENWAIGKDGDQLIYLKEDLKHFRQLTSGHGVILGRKTLATFPNGMPLKNRLNHILSHNPQFQLEGAVVHRTIDSILQTVQDDDFVIGGASVYEQLLPYCDTVYVTKIHATFPADCYFPNLDIAPDWGISEESAPLEQDGIAYHFVTYRRTT